VRVCRIFAGTMPARARSRKPTVYPIILAAGPSGQLPFPKALAPFEGKTALERAVETCRGTPDLGRPIIVLGCDMRRVLAAWRKGGGTRARSATIVRNPNWRKGQLTSLLTGLGQAPHGASAFLLYPVDYPLLTPRIIARLLRAFHTRKKRQGIVFPAIGSRSGHPIVVSRALVAEFRACARRGGTARDVIYRETHADRMLRVPVRDAAIFRDFDSPASYRLCLRLLRRRAAPRS